MPPRPSPLRSAETRERPPNSNDMLSPAQRYREHLPSGKFISAVRDGAIWRRAGVRTMACRSVAALNHHGALPLATAC
jgi:hypothetical protein